MDVLTLAACHLSGHDSDHKALVSGLDGGSGTCSGLYSSVSCYTRTLVRVDKGRPPIELEAQLFPEPPSPPSKRPIDNEWLCKVCPLAILSILVLILLPKARGPPQSQSLGKVTRRGPADYIPRDDDNDTSYFCSTFTRSSYEACSFLSHNAEADAVDVLLELEGIQAIIPFVQDSTYTRGCSYIVGCVSLLVAPDDKDFLELLGSTANKGGIQKPSPFPCVLATWTSLWKTFNPHQTCTSASRVLGISLMLHIRAMQKQLAYLLARRQVTLPPELLSKLEEDRPLLLAILDNTTPSFQNITNHSLLLYRYSNPNR